MSIIQRVNRTQLELAEEHLKTCYRESASEWHKWDFHRHYKQFRAKETARMIMALCEMNNPIDDARRAKALDALVSLQKNCGCPVL